MLHTNDIIFDIGGLGNEQNYFYEYRVSEEELAKLKQAARIEAYASYSEFVRRTALKEAERVIDQLKK